MVAVYYLTLFFSAFLLFLIQPIIPKKLLPIMGGTTELWNTCILFYQIVLLAGYAYTHFASRLLTPRRHGILHLALMIGAVAFLPLTLNLNTQSTPTEEPIKWVLTTLALTVGPLFFLLSTTAPLVQRWFFATSSHKTNTPYHLYAFSNAGSMAALFGYVLIIEPGLTYTHQTEWWSLGYWFFIFIVGIVALNVIVRNPHSEPAEKDSSATSEPSAQDRLWWILLAFVPSSLMLGVTSYITSNLATVPLLWVLPLAAYLLTFILTFWKRQLHAGRVLFSLQKTLFILVTLDYLTNHVVIGLIGAKSLILLQLATFSINAFMCHNELSQRRPHAKHLTEFFFFIAVGGALGGVFNALIAPAIFSTIIEYPIVLAIAYFVIHYDSRQPISGYGVDILTSAVFGFTVFLANTYVFNSNSLALRSGFLLYAVVFFFVARKRYLTIALCGALICIGGDYSSASYVKRSYFGTYKVSVSSNPNKTELMNGKISHGRQYHSPELRAEPQLYYSKDEPFGIVYSAITKRRAIHSVGVVGLGAGTMATYAEAGQRWVFYEIDPIVIEIASNPAYFTYLSDSKGTVEIKAGDGRLLLANAPEDFFDIIVIDAFSSDSIPIHLLTKEAFDMFLSKLTDRGVILYHISNAYLDLSRPLRELAAKEGKDSLYCRVSSQWFVIMKNSEDFKALGELPICKEIEAREGFRLWSDDYSSIIGALK